MTDNYPVAVEWAGIADRFAETGPYFALLDCYGVAVGDIVAAARQAVAAKKS